jgi:hypothetical protein
MFESVPESPLTSLALAALMLLGAGCAQDVGDIDRTQPDKIDKEIFESNDEWYMTQTVTDTDFQGSGPVFPGLESPLKRIRWEVTEEFLYAYSTTSPQEGLHDGQIPEDKKKLGAVAVFPITSHFDVQRQYNSATGEPSNVIVENRSDRPWYEREYMRVDWSANLVDGRGNLTANLGQLSSVAYDLPQESDDVHPNRTRIGENYLDVTVRYAFQPALNQCAMNLGIDSIAYCNAGKVSVRTSFKRITDEMEGDFEPTVLNDEKRLTNENGEQIMTDRVYADEQGYTMEVRCNETTLDYMRRNGDTGESCTPASFDYFDRFGYFRTKRVDYNEDRRNKDEQRKYYAQRWDIWETIEGQSEPKPIVFHLNAQYPKDMIASAKEVQRQWDEAMKQAVRLKARSQGYGYGGSIDQVTERLESVGEKLANNPELLEETPLRPEDVEAYKQGKMFFIRKNSCMPGPLSKWIEEYGGKRDADRKDPTVLFYDAVEANEGTGVQERLWNMDVQARIQLCANLEWATAPRDNARARFTYERRGDIRYSFFNWVREDHGYWSGYGPSGADPTTGEIISADANYAGTPLRERAQEAADLIKYMNGELENQSIRFGTHIHDYLNGVEQKQQSLTPGELPEEFERELDRRNQQMSASDEYNDQLPDTEDLPDKLKKLGPEGFERKFDEVSRRIEQVKQSDTRFTEFYENPTIKNELMKSGQMQMLVNSVARERFGKEPSDSQMHQAYLDVVNPDRLNRRQKQSQKWMAEHNILSTNALRRAIEGLATYRGASEYFKGMDREEIVRHFEENLFIGTQLHEVGHTMGLRHNFEASRDALNWHDEYWKLQKEAKTNPDVVKPEGGEVPEGKQSVYELTGPLAAQITGNEDVKYVNEEEFQQASIMDYTADMTGRFAGLGKYDQAAINFAYADHVEVWENFQKPNRLGFDKFTADYSRLPELYGKAITGSDVDGAEQFAAGVDFILERRKWIPVDQAIERRKEGIAKNTGLAEQWWSEDGPGARPNDPEPYVSHTVPYDFCSDRKAGISLGCDVFDHGGNDDEVVRHAFNKYRFLQPFWRYKGQDIDLGFPYGSLLASRYQSRVIRTLQVAERPFRYFSIYEWYGYDLGDYQENLRAASIGALNFYAELMAMPEPGRYCKYDRTSFLADPNWYYDLNNTYVPADYHAQEGECEDPLDIERGEGQFYNYELTDEYHYRVRRVGTYIDKSLAALSFFNISANWVNSDYLTDIRANNITFYSLFKEEMLNWLGDMIIGKSTGFAGSVVDEEGEGDDKRYIPPKIVDLESYEQDGQSTQIRENTPKILTRFGFNEQLQTMAGAMIVNSSWQDRSVDFRQYLKVIRQEEDKQAFDEDTEIATFTHPVTNVIYKAPQTSDDRSISVEVIERANKMKEEWQYAMCLEQYFDASESGTQYLKDECGDQDFPVQIDPENPADTRETLSEYEAVRLRQLEDVVAKLTQIRDVGAITDGITNR